MASHPRYQRQVILPGIGEEGQEKLSRAHAVIVGVGALGCVSADVLARAGVGTITLVDRDIVEPSNLQRQSLYSEKDAEQGIPKAEAAARRLREINSTIDVVPGVADVGPRNVEKLVLMNRPRNSRTAIVDGTDNFEARYLLNDVAVKHGLPYAYAGVVGTRGMQTTFVPRSAGQSSVTPCLRCIFESPPEPGSTPTCDTAGVLAPAAWIVAAAQAADVLKVLVGRVDLLSGSLLDFDLWSNSRRRVELMAMGPRDDCPCCGLRRFEFLDGGSGGESATLCGRNGVQVGPISPGTLDLDLLAERLRRVVDVSRSQFMVRARLSGGQRPVDMSVFADGRAIFRGTTDVSAARALYARYVGG